MSQVIDSPRRSFGRTAFVALVLLSCLRLWLGPITITERAQAQIPDSGLQRKLLIQEAKRTNQLLEDIKQILRTQTLHVRLQGADNTRTDN